MKKTKFAALKYLLDIDYPYLEMADYLLPCNKKQTIQQKCEMFAVKNSMINIPANFSSKSEEKCKC